MTQHSILGDAAFGVNRVAIFDVVERPVRGLLVQYRERHPVCDFLALINKCSKSEPFRTDVVRVYGALSPCDPIKRCAAEPDEPDHHNCQNQPAETPRSDQRRVTSFRRAGLGLIFDTAAVQIFGIDVGQHRKHGSVHAARTALQISGAVFQLTRNLASSN
jgi:hypothetical protein